MQGGAGLDCRNLRGNPGRALGEQDAGDDQPGGDQGSNAPSGSPSSSAANPSPKTGTSNENGATVEAEYARIRYAHRPQPTVVAANAM